MSRDAREQAQLEDVADKTYNMYKRLHSLTDSLVKPRLLLDTREGHHTRLSRSLSTL